MIKITKIVLNFTVLLLLVGLCKRFLAKEIKLKQVFILSRHNVRNPVGKELKRYTPKPWPQWVGPPGLLTSRGAQLEGYLGEYFSEWFKQEHLFSEGCPDEDTVYVYANTVSRTKATARAFIDSAFKNCGVTVHHKNFIGRDPLFLTIILNTTEAFRDTATKEINRQLQNNSKLKAVYSELNKILEIEESDVCKEHGICNLVEANNTILVKAGELVKIEGPLSIGHLVVDAFTMSYYDGMPIEDIAWGQITTPEKWHFLTEMDRQNQEIRHTAVGKDIAKPLMEYITKTFKNYDEMPKLMLLVGHDSNMNSIATALGFQSFDLPNQNEKFPIGGKYVFQRWTDGESDYLKVEYVYPSWSQLRNGAKYSLESPPERFVLRLKWCNTDENGFCSWEEFVNKL